MRNKKVSPLRRLIEELKEVKGKKNCLDELIHQRASECDFIQMRRDEITEATADESIPPHQLEEMIEDLTKRSAELESSMAEYLLAAENLEIEIDLLKKAITRMKKNIRKNLFQKRNKILSRQMLKWCRVRSPGMTAPLEESERRKGFRAGNKYFPAGLKVLIPHKVDFCSNTESRFDLGFKLISKLHCVLSKINGSSFEHITPLMELLPAVSGFRENYSKMRVHVAVPTICDNLIASGKTARITTVETRIWALQMGIDTLERVWSEIQELSHSLGNLDLIFSANLADKLRIQLDEIFEALSSSLNDFQEFRRQMISFNEAKILHMTTRKSVRILGEVHRQLALLCRKIEKSQGTSKTKYIANLERRSRQIRTILPGLVQKMNPQILERVNRHVPGSFELLRQPRVGTRRQCAVVEDQITLDEWPANQMVWIHGKCRVSHAGIFGFLSSCLESRTDLDFHFLAGKIEAPCKLCSKMIFISDISVPWWRGIPEPVRNDLIDTEVCDEKAWTASKKSHARLLKNTKVFLQEQLYIAHLVNLPLRDVLVMSLPSCPFCDGEMGGVLYKGDTDRLYSCLKCNAQKCANRGCNGFFNPPRGHSHTDMTCETFALLVSDGEDAASEAALRAIPRCPHCNTTTERRDGCNHITCICGTHWCYVCGYSADKTKRLDEQESELYGHLGDPGGCGLWPRQHQD